MRDGNRAAAKGFVREMKFFGLESLELLADSRISRVAAGTATMASDQHMAAAQKALTTDELLARVKAGERELFYDLVRPFEKSVFMAALSILGNEADAEEVAQEAMLKAFAHLQQFRGEAKFSTWLVQIAVNEAKVKLRKDRRHLYDSIEEGSADDEGDYMPRDFADWREIPSEALQRRELRDALSRALASLSSKNREVLVLRDVQHLSTQETAQVLGVPEQTVKTRLLRARLQMREALAPGIDASWASGRAEYKKVRPW